MKLSQDTERPERTYTLTLFSDSEDVDYFATCNESGLTDWLPCGQKEIWFVLSDAAKKLFKGQTEERNGVTFGLVFKGGL